MPKIVYANIAWFIIVIGSTTMAAVERRGIEQWEQMPDVRINYDIYFVGVFGIYCLVSVVGLLRKSPWGYKIATGFNYVLALLPIAPGFALLIFSLKNDYPLSFASDVWWGLSVDNLALGLISIAFIIAMRRSNVKAVFGVA